jgi:hypothetical protein
LISLTSWPFSAAMVLGRQPMLGEEREFLGEVDFVSIDLAGHRKALLRFVSPIITGAARWREDFFKAVPDGVHRQSGLINFPAGFQRVPDL